MTLTAPSLFRSLSFSTDLAEKLPDWISGKHIRNGAQEVHGVHGGPGIAGKNASGAGGILTCLPDVYKHHTAFLF